jgi:hypothetical protein
LILLNLVLYHFFRIIATFYIWVVLKPAFFFPPSPPYRGLTSLGLFFPPPVCSHHPGGGRKESFRGEAYEGGRVGKRDKFKMGGGLINHLYIFTNET